MEKYNKQITQKESRIGMYASLAVIIIAGVIGAVMTKYMRSPWTFWGVYLAATVVYVVLSFKYWRRVQGEDASKGIWRLWLPLLVYAAITIGVATGNRTSRVDNCIPARELVSAEGYIYDTEKAINFYQGCGKYVFDEPTKDFVRENRRLPSWIMDKGGYTSDAVGWWQYHSSHSASPYNLTPSVRAKLLNGPPHKLPQEAYK